MRKQDHGDGIRQRYRSLSPSLDERQLRLWAASQNEGRRLRRQRWTGKNARRLAADLRSRGYRASHQLVAE